MEKKNLIDVEFQHEVMWALDGVMNKYGLTFLEKMYILGQMAAWQQKKQDKTHASDFIGQAMSAIKEGQENGNI